MMTLMLIHVNWVPCHHSMACPQVAGRGYGLMRIHGIQSQRQLTLDRPPT